jgi:phosphohistidine phosphatase SixA
VLVTAAGAAQPASSAGKSLLAQMRAGGYVILMRHASSPRTPPDALQADPDNPQHERQLDAEGRASAQAFGEALRRLRLPIGEVLSSPTYRALETLRLAKLAPVTTYAQLGDGGQSMQADQSGARAAWLKERAAQTPRAGTNTLIVTHFPNIAEAYGSDAAGLSDGEALILHPDGRGAASLVTRIKIDAWPQLESMP